MLSDKEQKKVFKQTASHDPDRYYPTDRLRALGFERKHCSCGMYFWTVNADQETCGDPACSGGFQVVRENPSKVRLSYVDVWKELVALLEPRGYLPIKRYPVVARWNPTTEFTIASISAFQPYVVAGDVPPPAKKVLIPQFCLRFGDVENVGITGSHCTGFVMIGQHVFVSPEEWDQGQLFTDILDFLLRVLQLPKTEITIHEDAWAGGGNFGPCLEFFSRGVELFNQVYTMFEQTPEGNKDLELKVLDMGLGMERCAWFSQGTPNMYEAVFPLVLDRLREQTGVDLDLELYGQFSRYSAYLNIDEVDDINAAWDRVGAELGLPADELRERILPMTAIYSIAEHTRALLFAITDGMLPSNVGGGYNLRVIFRRAIGFVDQFKWDVDLGEVCAWHAEELVEIFPEVSENLHDVRAVLAVEKQKYEKTKKKARRLVKSIVKKQEITPDLLVSLYDSNGINPEIIRAEARALGKTVKIPEDFYNRVVALHEQREQVHQTQKDVSLHFEGVPDTTAEYYDDYATLQATARVTGVDGRYVALDRTIAYPTSGGQLHDNGTIDGQPFTDVFKVGSVIVHEMADPPAFEVGDEVTVEVEADRRKQLAQHHTATHIINAAARDVLGNHVNQAGAKKTEKKATLDITHFASLSRDILDQIEARANEIVARDFPLNSRFMTRGEAEQTYGMRIYQGGAVPGKHLRIVQIPGVDVEACGGTHLNHTGEVGHVKILKAQKVQDGIVRLTFTAGRALERLERQRADIRARVRELLGVPEAQLLPRARELFEKWKALQKALKLGQSPEPADLELTFTATVESKHLLEELADVFSVKIKDLPRTIERFLTEWREAKTQLAETRDLFSPENLEAVKEAATPVGPLKLHSQVFPDAGPKDLQGFAIKFVTAVPDLVVVLLSPSPKGWMVAMAGNSGRVKELGVHLGNVLREVLQEFDGRGGGRPDNGQGILPDPTVPEDRVVAVAREKLQAALDEGA